MAEATWLSQELPILEAIRRAEISGDNVDSAAAAAVPGLPRERYMTIIESLNDASYLEARILPGDNQIMSVHVLRLMERGRRAVGQWPSEDVFEAFLELLKNRIEETDNDVEKGRLRRALESMTAIGRQVGTAVLTDLARQAAGL
jgi:hypothetical protein